MKKQDVIDYFGGVYKAARALNVTAPTIYQWGEDVPEIMQYKVQVKTKGKLKADQSKERQYVKKSEAAE